LISPHAPQNENLSFARERTAINMIEIEQLRFRYPRSDFLLDLPRLKIETGEKVAIVGPSGCGKTTLLNLIAGIVVPDSGSVSVAGNLVSERSDAARRNFRIANVGMVFQQFELVEYLDARSNIVLPFSINSTLKLDSSIRSQASELAQLTGLSEKLGRRASQLSQGEQQRVAICRALITSPKLILADEPTGNLDPKNKQVILDLIFDQANQRGQTLVVVTHDMGILKGFDRTIDFEQFRIDETIEPAAAEVRQ
jgi:putative ABC transport system ATP-binding protein